MGYTEITKREIIFSIAIAAVLIFIGVFISEKIQTNIEDSNIKYEKAAQINDKDMFEYSMQTNLGNAFVYGDLEGVNPVSYEEITGNYIYISKTTEKYTMHTRTYTTTDSKGHTTTHTQVYWTWDQIDFEDRGVAEVIFMGNKFDVDYFHGWPSHGIDTIYQSSDVRNVYKGVDCKLKGTIFTKLYDSTISKDTKFYNNKTLKETYEKCLTSSTKAMVGFWVCWGLLIVGVIIGFYCIDNRWLEG